MHVVVNGDGQSDNAGFFHSYTQSTEGPISLSKNRSSLQANAACLFFSSTCASG